MADAVRHVPEKYGPVRAVLRPRLGSYGRRLLACLSPLLTGAVLLLLLWWRRPAPAVTAVVLVLVLMVVHDAMRRETSNLAEAETMTAAELLVQEVGRATQFLGLEPRGCQRDRRERSEA